MYIMDRYSVKQPQNIIIKVKIKEHGIGKKNTGKNLNEIYIIAFIVSVGQLGSCAALFTLGGKALQLTWYDSGTYLQQLKPPSTVDCLLGECLW